MTDPGLADYLDPGEVMEAEFAPAFGLFIWREVVVLGLTALAFVPIAIWTQDPRFLAMLPLALLLDLVVGSTFTDWQGLRNLRWLLTDRRLIQIDHRDPTETRSIAIGQIARLRRILFWRLFVVAEDRSMITLSYVPGLPALHQRLIARRNALP